MSLKRFQIVLDQPVYYSGQNVTGRLIVNVNRAKSMRGVVGLFNLTQLIQSETVAIFLKYTGAAHVQWSETRTVNKQSTTVTYSSTEQYLSLQQLVFGNESEDCTLPAGEHNFVFNFLLPINLPSSFEGSYGRVRYFLKATMARNWKFDHTTTLPMTVMSVFDLNHHPLAAIPVAENNSKTFWGHSQPLSMTVNIPVRGFVPGQIIPITVFLCNQSGVKVKAIGVSLKQQVKFHTSSKSNYSRTYIFKNEFPVPKGHGDEEISLNLQLPPAPSSYLEFCRIMDLDYQLSVTAKVDGWYHKDLKAHTEIIVGNIPIMGYQRPIPVQEVVPGTADADYPPPYGFVVPGTTYENLPPPSYEMSVQLDRSEQARVKIDDDDNDKVNFSPLYPVYKFET